MEASIKLIELLSKIFRKNEIIYSISFCILIIGFGVIFHYYLDIPHLYSVPITILVTISLDTLLKLVIPDTTYWKKEAMLLSHVSETKINKELSGLKIQVPENKQKAEKESIIIGIRKKGAKSILLTRLCFLITTIIGLFAFAYSEKDAKGRQMIIQFYDTLDEALKLRVTNKNASDSLFARAWDMLSQKKKDVICNGSTIALVTFNDSLQFFIRGYFNTISHKIISINLKEDSQTSHLEYIVLVEVKEYQLLANPNLNSDTAIPETVAKYLIPDLNKFCENPFQKYNENKIDSTLKKAIVDTIISRNFSINSTRNNNEYNLSQNPRLLIEVIMKFNLKLKPISHWPSTCSISLNRNIRSFECRFEDNTILPQDLIHKIDLNKE